MSSTAWYVRLGDQVLGPISHDELRDRALQGGVTAQTLVSGNGTDWTEAATVAGIVFGSALSPTILSRLPTEPPPAVPESPSVTVQGDAPTSQAPKSFSAKNPGVMAGCILGGLILLICVLSWTEFITFVLWIVFAVAVLIAVRCGATALLTPNRRFGAVVRVVLCAIIATVVWNFIPSGNNPPPAKPKIVDYTLTTNWFDDNEVAVTLRNDGQDGWVVVRYRTTTTDTDIKRRPGVEVWARHNLTSEDDSEYYLDQHTWTKGVWACCTFLKAGEQKLIQIKLPNHSSWDNQCYPSVTPVLVKPENIEVK